MTLKQKRSLDLLVKFECYFQQGISIAQNQEPYRKILAAVYHTLGESKSKSISLASDGWGRAISIVDKNTNKFKEVCGFNDFFRTKYRFMLFQTYFFQSPLNLGRMRYQLDENLQYLEVIPCGPTIFEQIVKLDEHVSRNLKYRLHFGNFEFIGVKGNFDLKIYDMEQPPTEHFLQHLPTKNSYIGLHFTADHLSPVWWNMLEKFKKLFYLRIGCNLNMVAELTEKADWMLATFYDFWRIEVEIIDTQMDQRKILNFLNAFAEIETKIWVPKNVKLNFIRDPKCSYVSQVNSYGVVGRAYMCMDNRKGLLDL